MCLVNVISINIDISRENVFEVVSYRTWLSGSFQGIDFPIDPGLLCHIPLGQDSQHVDTHWSWPGCHACSGLTHWPLGDLNEILEKWFFKVMLVIGGWGISCEINTLRWLSLDLTDGKSTLVQVIAWCCKAASHFLSLCWPRSMSPYGVTRPQRVKFSSHYHSQPMFNRSWLHFYLFIFENEYQDYEHFGRMLKVHMFIFECVVCVWLCSYYSNWPLVSNVLYENCILYNNSFSKLTCLSHCKCAIIYMTNYISAYSGSKHGVMW